MDSSNWTDTILTASSAASPWEDSTPIRRQLVNPYLDKFNFGCFFSCFSWGRQHTRQKAAVCLDSGSVNLKESSVLTVGKTQEFLQRDWMQATAFTNTFTRVRIARSIEQFPFLDNLFSWAGQSKIDNFTKYSLKRHKTRQNIGLCSGNTVDYIEVRGFITPFLVRQAIHNYLEQLYTFFSVSYYRSPQITIILTSVDLASLPVTILLTCVDLASLPVTIFFTCTPVGGRENYEHLSTNIAAAIS